MKKQKRKKIDKDIIEPRWTKENIITVIIVIIALIVMVLWGIPHFDYYPGEPKVPPFK